MFSVMPTPLTLKLKNAAIAMPLSYPKKNALTVAQVHFFVNSTKVSVMIAVMLKKEAIDHEYELDR